MAQVLRLAPEQITPQLSREDHEAWDSLGHMRLCLALEDEFGVKFDDKQVVGMVTFGAVLETMEALAPA